MPVEDPEVSIIVPVRNAAALIGKCIESVLRQKYTGWELLIVNDGSSDATCEIASSFAEKDTRIDLYDSKGSGVSAARNLGLELAKGKYITFLDADDMLEPDFLSEAAKIAETKNADIVQSSFYYMFPDGRKERDNESAEGVFDNKAEIMDAYFSGIIGKINVACWGKLFKHELIADLRFDENLMIQEDAFFTFNCCKKASRVVCFNEPLYCYYQDPGSTRHRAFEGSKMHYFTVFDRELEDFKGNTSLTFRINYRKLVAALDLTGKIINDDTGSEYLGELRDIALRTYDEIKKNGNIESKTKLKVFMLRHFPSLYYGLLKMKKGRRKNK